MKPIITENIVTIVVLIKRIKPDFRGHQTLVAFDKPYVTSILCGHAPP